MATLLTEPAADTRSNFNCYDSQFFENIEGPAFRSADVIVPLVLNLVPAKSVVDVGCGRGAWLKVFQQHGIGEIAGYDGQYVDSSDLLIPKDNFHPVDLSKHFKVAGRFDLAVCLEVAEHLPTGCSRRLVNTLCDAADVIVFSAAVPGQRGTCHINEQWPEFWRLLFARRGFERIDCVRPEIWDNRAVAGWYRQNIYLFASEKGRENYPMIAQALSNQVGLDFEILLPHVLAQYTSFFELLRGLPRAFWRSLRNRLAIGRLKTNA
jgi:SAM-dependent methyltransferase